MREAKEHECVGVGVGGEEWGESGGICTTLSCSLLVWGAINAPSSFISSGWAADAAASPKRELCTWVSA